MQTSGDNGEKIKSENLLTFQMVIIILYCTANELTIGEYILYLHFNVLIIIINNFNPTVIESFWGPCLNHVNM